ncbi:pyruvate formate-lyase activating enzyme [Klebsiella grimontii]|uniref:Pyruvate formate-lyase activating enzyme n=1 Tax=Klebsiella grimontii TaxID=2058152 RepID=A0A7H4P796_9ENTR|nr:pyruvate formate-lyase activating enzyme [Klebsiella grimontii]
MTARGSALSSSSKGVRWGCRWCQNPESRARTADLLYDARLCLDGCDLCQQAAPEVITRKLDGLIIHRENSPMRILANCATAARPPH